MKGDRIRVYVTGTRGIPEIQGGVETHCLELYTRLAEMGCDVTVARRRSYAPADAPLQYKGVAIRDIFAPRIKSLEAVVHTFLSVIDARRHGCDIIHIHAVGPGLLVPFARLLGLRVVTTNHGADYRRAKWGRVAKAALKLGERFATRMSHAVIAITPGIACELKQKYGREDIGVVPNGVTYGSYTVDPRLLESLGLVEGKYILGVGRLVEEKGIHDLIEAYKELHHPDVRLVIAGSADHPTPYSCRLMDMARETGVVMAGEVKKRALESLLGGAALYVLPSYHEGLSISLLEAMAAGKDIALSDIPANRLPQLSDGDYFAPGDVAGMAAVIDRKLSDIHARRYNLESYDWDDIAARTLDVYRQVLRE